MAKDILRIATRKSALALWQAEFVRQSLVAAHPGLQVELLTLSTRGDKILDTPLAKIGGKALFVKELEEALLEGRADLAVHSMKDVPMELPEGLELPVILAREDPRDAFVSAHYTTIDELPQGARVGTCSLRRQCQLRARRPDLEVANLRGNVGTRLGKLDDGQFEAIVLASSGLKRLELEERITAELDPGVMLPAVGQGALGIECRAGDAPVLDRIRVLDHGTSHTRVRAERAMNRRLEGGCQVPIAGYAEIDHDVIVLRGLVGRPDGTEVVEGVISGRPEDAEELGTVLGDDLLSRGADRILAELYAEQ